MKCTTLLYKAANSLSLLSVDYMSTGINAAATVKSDTSKLEESALLVLDTRHTTGILTAANAIQDTTLWESRCVSFLIR